MAAPGVAGIVALVFEEAVARGINLSIDQTIQILTDSARRNPPGGAAWNDRYGHGRISAAKAIKAVIDMSAGGGGGAGAATTAKKASKPLKPKK